MTKHGFVRASVVLAALSLALVACGGSTKSATPKLTNKLSITGTEYKFEVDKTSVNEGTLQVTFRNTGQEMHMTAWGKLKSGVTFEKFTQTLQTKQDEAFGLVDEADDGSPGLLTPGQQSTLTTNLLKAGTYALICFIPAPDKTPHAQKGMVASLEVKGAATASPSPFAVISDADVTMTDYSFGTIPESLKKGKGTFKFVNAGKQPHEATLARLEPGKTFEDADKYFTALFEGPTPPTGPLPAQLVGGFFSIAPGTEVWLTLDLPPGNYVLVCGEETDDGKAHEDLGMKTEFTVA